MTVMDLMMGCLIVFLIHIMNLSPSQMPYLIEMVIDFEWWSEN